MVDKISKEKRRSIMQSVKSKNTAPERVVRSFVFKAGLRYRLHVKSLPGTPDIVFPSRKLVVEIRGCFWHGHMNEYCNRGKLPASNIEKWQEKIERNIVRDVENEEKLRKLGWQVIVIWECELKGTRRESTMKELIENIKKSPLKER